MGEAPSESFEKDCNDSRGDAELSREYACAVGCGISSERPCMRLGTWVGGCCAAAGNDAEVGEKASEAVRLQPEGHSGRGGEEYATGWATSCGGSGEAEA